MPSDQSKMMGQAGRSSGADDLQSMPYQTLVENVRNLRALLNAAVDAIITINERGIIIGVNPSATTMFGYTQEEMVGHNINILMPEPYQSEHDQYLAQYRKTGVKKIIGVGREVTAKRKDGSTFPIELSVGEFWDGDGLMFTGIIHDITRRRELEQHLAKVRDEEQQRIAQELHDGLGGQMTGISLLIKAMRTRLEAEDSPYVADIAELAQHVEDAHAQLRSISSGISPVEVLPEGLSQALSAFAQKTEHSGQVHCQYHADGVDVHQPTTAMHLFRIAQEAVSNAIRHGHASQIDIHLEHEDEHLLLTISNDGSSIQHLPDSCIGMGLRTMKHRSDLMGGTLRVVPAEGGGTVVICRVPSRAVKQDEV